MNAIEREAFYDEHVAPVLLELAKKCQDNGLQFLAAVEWDRERMTDGGWGKTIAIEHAELTAATFMIYAAMMVGGNLDQFIIEMRKYARQHGPGSSMTAHLWSREEHPE